MMDKIEEIYRKYNRPATAKLFQLAKSEGLSITLKQVKEFLGGRSEEQQLKETKTVKQQQGHLVSYNPFNRLQLDIFVLNNFWSIFDRFFLYLMCEDVAKQTLYQEFL